MANILGRISPDVFREMTGCSAGELRLITANAAADYSRRYGTLDGDRSRAILLGIREAHRQAEED